MRQDDLVRAVGESPFFQALSEEERLSMVQLGRVFLHGQGDVLFQPRQAPGALVLVLEGLVEVSRSEVEGLDPEPVAYLGPGAVLAESKVITGTAFSSLARFPEGGSTLQWPRPVILRKLYASRDLSMQYVQNLARRLEGSFANLGAGRKAVKLGGRLDHFDLPTILQTVVDSAASGVLTVVDAQGSTFGTIHVHDRTVGGVRCGALTGESAFYEILVTPPERGSFSFTSSAPPDDGTSRLQLPMLLLEAARIQDELRRFRGAIPPHVELRAASLQLELSNEVDPELAAQIWDRLSVRPTGWGELAKRLPFSRAQVALAVQQLVVDGSLASDHPVPRVVRDERPDSELTF
jgi:CRP-like cAMP-binding protein